MDFKELASSFVENLLDSAKSISCFFISPKTSLVPLERTCVSRKVLSNCVKLLTASFTKFVIPSAAAIVVPIPIIFDFRFSTVLSTFEASW